MRVIATSEAWSGFLRRAKKSYPREHIEAIWGEETVDSIRITNFERMRLNKATGALLDYDDVEVKRQKWAASQEGKVFLGTVHTHPGRDCDSAPSAHDHHAAALDGERIMGIVALYKNTTGTRYTVETNWWVPQRKLEFVVGE